MKLDLRLDRIKPFLLENRFWLELAGTTAAVLTIALLVGRAAHRRADVLEKEVERLERVAHVYEQWKRQYQAPAPDEIIAWQESEAALAQLGIAQPTPIAVAQLITRNADEMGIANAQIRAIKGDDLDAPARTVGGRTFTSSDFGLNADIESDFDGMLTFLATLPLAVQPLTVQVQQGDGRELKTHVVLAVYESEGPRAR